MSVDDYRTKKEKNPDLQPLGPPHTLIFGALLDVAVETRDVGAASQENLRKLRDDINACEKQEDAEMLIKVCRLAKTAKEDEVNLILHMTSLGERRFCVIDGLKQIGARHLRGSAPPGYMEEELQEWTEYIESQIA